MDLTSLYKQLIELANNLDGIGVIKAADRIDGLIKISVGDEDKFIDCLKSKPDDIDNIEVYQDYLYEQSQDNKAQFLKIRQLPEFIGKRFDKLPAEYKSIITEIDLAWIKNIAPVVDIICPYDGSQGVFFKAINRDQERRSNLEQNDPEYLNDQEFELLPEELAHNVDVDLDTAYDIATETLETNKNLTFFCSKRGHNLTDEFPKTFGTKYKEHFGTWLYLGGLHDKWFIRND